MAKEGSTKIKTATGRDNSSHSVKNDMGKSMGGGKTDLSHSLTGTSAVQGSAKGK